MKPLILLLSSLLIAFTPVAWAELSRDEAATVARQASGGRVLALDQIAREGRPLWRVKVLTPQGEVKVVLIDVASGRPLQSR